MSDLFRKEVYEAAYRRLEGAVLLATPLSVRILAGACILLVATALTVASLGSYSRRETVQGMMVPSGGLIRVTAHQGGVVESLTVREGQQVAGGANLAALRVSADVGGEDASRALQTSVETAHRAAILQLAVQDNKLKETEASLTIERAGLEAQLVEGERRIKAMEAHKVLAENAVKRGQALYDQSFLTRADMDTLQNALISADEGIAEAKSAQLTAQRQLDDVNAQLRGMPLEHENNRAQADQADAQYAEKKVTVAYQTLYGAIAPLPGTVVAVAAEAGQSLTPGATVATVAGKGSNLVAELYVPSSAAGFVKPGQEVQLKYDAFPFQSFGAGEGRVVSVSRTALNPTEIPIQGLDFKEPMFRVVVAVKKLTVRAYNEDHALRPGMKLTADIIVDRRSLVKWILDPLYAAGVRS